MSKKFEAAVYWSPRPGPEGKIKKRGSLQVCEQYVREQTAKVKPGSEVKWDIIDDKNDPRLLHRGVNAQNDVKIHGKKEIPKEEFWRVGESKREDPAEPLNDNTVDDGPDVIENITVDDQSLKDILNDEPAKEEGEE